MSDGLKKFIEQNREDFDQLEPKDLWPAIVLGIKPTLGMLFLKYPANLWKFGFGASVLVVTTIVTLINVNKDHSLSAVKSSPKNTNCHAAKETVFIAPADTTVEGQKLQIALRPAKNTPVAQPFVADTPPPAPAALPIENIPPELKRMEQTGILCRNTGDVCDTIFNGVKNIEVRGEFLDVSIRAHDGDYIAVESVIGEKTGDVVVLGWSSYSKKDYVLVYERQDTSLLITVSCAKHGDGKLVKKKGSSEAYLHLKVPKSTHTKVLNTSGDIYVAGMEGERFDLKTALGNITAENIKADLKLYTGSGNIKVSAIKGDVQSASGFGHQIYKDVNGNISVSSGSGDVTMIQIQGNLDIRSSFGNQKIENVRGRLRSVSASGNVIVNNLTGDLRVKSTFGTQRYEQIDGDVDCTTHSGDIRINGLKGAIYAKSGYGDIEGKEVMLCLECELKTSSGDIRLSLLNKMDDLSFDLNSTSGYLAVEKEYVRQKAERQLRTGTGPIKIKATSVYGKQMYR